VSTPARTPPRRSAPLPARGVARAGRIVRFAVYFLGQLILANLRVAWEVLTPGYGMRAGIIAVPSRARTDLEIVTLANLISLTPGTLTLEVTEDRSLLFVHTLYVDSPDEFRDRIGELENRLLGAMR
jgi:multicomponent Na+:H+ antiporter subunit E